MGSEDKHDCCEYWDVDIGGVDLVTGAQYETTFCAKCGETIQVGRHKTWRGQELEQLRREAGIPEEALREGIEAHRALFEGITRLPGDVNTQEVYLEVDSGAFARFRNIIPKILYMPRSSGT